MKKKDWNEGLNHLDPDLVEEYVIQKEAYAQKKKRVKPYWLAAVAAMLVLTICLSMFMGGNIIPGGTTGPVQIGSKPTTDPNAQFVNLLAAPVYPEMAVYPNYTDYPDWKDYDQAYAVWRESQHLQYNQPSGYADSLTNFFYTSIAQFLQGDGNPTYSPVNVYLAMAMLAETTDGNSRRQILDLFGADNIEQLRQQAGYVWNAHYCEDGQTSLLLANSLWLDNAYVFKQPAAELLANRYYASSFNGDLGSEEMNQYLQNWLNENTGGLLTEQAENVHLSPETVFALASTVYFTASWKEEFSANSTKEGVFHSANGDISAPFMNRTMDTYMYFWGDNFTAVYLKLTGNNTMWLILPDEGYTVTEILESDDYLRMTMDPGVWEDKGVYTINLSLPKFDVSDHQDLCEGMKALGVTDIFNYEISDFTPLTDTPELFVSKIDHAARVAIDEKGCVGAAFTVIQMEPGTAPGEWEEVDIVLDRPFLFVVSSRDNLPLFSGVVNEP